jgi:hypothetical protein
MAMIEETRRQVDREIKMMKQTPRISDKSKFLNKKNFQQSKQNLISKAFPANSNNFKFGFKNRYF